MKIVRLVVLTTATVFFGSASAQTAALSVVALSVNDPRPVNVLAEKIEALSGIPVNYEDVQYAYAADTVDVTSSVVNPSYPAPVNFQVIIPRAAQLSAFITVDAATQKLSGPSSALNALNEVLSTASANTAIAGKFTVDNYENVFFVYPTQVRSTTGQFVHYAPVLSTPIDLPGLRQTAIETLEAILQQVSEKVGVKVGRGTMPFKALTSTVTISASQEPANYVLARFFAAVCASGVAAPQNSPGMSYHAFFDPPFKSYALNIHVVPNPNVAVSNQNPSKAPIQSTPSRWQAK